MSLTGLQSDRLRRDNKVLLFLEKTDNITIYEKYTPFKLEVDKFIAGYGILKNIIPLKDYNAALADTEDKAELRQKIAIKMSFICTLAGHYAASKENNELALLLATNKTDLANKMDESSLLPFVQNACKPLAALIKANDAEFLTYQITQPMLDAVLADAVKFNGMIGQSDVTASTATVANKNINAKQSVLSKLIIGMTKTIVFFKETNPDFYDAFFDIKKLIRYGLRHNGFGGSVTKDGNPVAKAKIVVEDTKKKKVTDSNGLYAIEQIKVGTYNVTCTLPDGTTKTEKLTVVKGKYTELNFDF